MDPLYLIALAPLVAYLIGRYQGYKKGYQFVHDLEDCLATGEKYEIIAHYSYETNAKGDLVLLKTKYTSRFYPVAAARGFGLSKFKLGTTVIAKSKNHLEIESTGD